MPKQTFFNLSDEKRNKIIRAGLDEFSDRGFKEASINRIIEGAGIPKGSFYQYFDDKKDMFAYICGMAVDEKLKYIDSALPDITSMDFFEAFSRMYTIGVRFGKEHPEYFRISNDLMNDNGLRREIYGEQSDKADMFYSNFLMLGIKNGYIRDDIDVGFIAKMLTSLTMSMGEYFLEKYGHIDLDKLEEYGHKFIDLIKYGISGGKGHD